MDTLILVTSIVAVAGFALVVVSIVMMLYHMSKM